MIEIHRFSEDGFSPKHQDYFLNNWRTCFDHFYLDDLPDHLKKHVLDYYEEMKKYINSVPSFFDDWEYGVFIFIKSLDDVDVDFYLNHLKYNEKNARKFWKAYLPDYVFVYVFGDKGFPIYMKLKDAVNERYDECFIPKKTIELIQEVNQN